MQLVDDLKQGDLKAFNAIYAEYHHRLYFFIKKKTQSTFLAEEVVQLTFIKLWNYKHTLKSNIDISIQLFHMVKQVMIDELRKEATRNRCEGESAQTPFTDNLVQSIEAKDLKRILEEELSDMPATRKLVFSLSRERGLSHKEISEMMGISTKTVEAHITKTLSQLKQYIYTIML